MELQLTSEVRPALLAHAVVPGCDETCEVDTKSWPAARIRRGMQILVLGCAFLIPLAVMPGLEQPFSRPKLMFLGAVVLAGLAVNSPRLGRVWQEFPFAIQAALLGWLGALGAAALVGEFASPAIFFLPLLGFGWLVLTVAVKPRPEALAWTLVASGGTIAAIGLAQFAGADPFALAGWVASSQGSSRMRVFATLGNPNFVAAFLGALLPLTFFLWMHSHKHRAPTLILLALQATAIVATGSRAVIVALLGAGLWMVMTRSGKRLAVFALIAVCIAGCVVAFSPSRDLATTLKGRFYIWKVALPHLVEHPVLGLGPGGFQAAFPTWETLHWQHSAANSDRRFIAVQDHAHNDYLEMFADYGVCGVLAFLSVLCAALRIAWARARREGNQLVVGASAGAIALGTVALVDFPLMRPAEVCLFWSLMALSLIAGQKGTRESARLSVI